MSIHDILCDRCGTPADFLGEGGHCPECGGDLCIQCAGSWTELAADDEPGFAVCDTCFEAIKDHSDHDYFAAATGMQHPKIAGAAPEDENMGVEYFDKINCDRCGKPSGFLSGQGGRCTQCKETLCLECAESWHEPCEYLCDRCHNARTDESSEKSAELQWTKIPPTGKDVGRWFAFRIRSVYRIAELTFSTGANRKLVLEMELAKLVELGCEFYGPLPR